MKTQLLPMSQLTQALLLAGLVAVAAPASAVEYWLRAETLGVNLPGRATPVPMWGYALDGTSCPAAPCAATVPGPALTVLPGDPVLTIHLTNNLPANTSIVIPGQAAAMTPVWDDGSTGPRPSATARVRSFTHEAIAGGGTAAYTWSNMKPGTYLYHSGTHPQVQVQMGLYGGISKNAAAGQAYTGVPHDNELMLLYSEIDPRMHDAVADGTYGTPAAPVTPECIVDILSGEPGGTPGQLTSALCYRPQYFLINGKPYQVGDPPLATLTAGQRTLLRFLNAGLQAHVPVINNLYMQMIAEDGNPYPWPANPRQQYSVLLPPAKSVDTIITPAAGTYPLYDRRLNLVNAASQDGGMLAFLEVTGGATNAPSITSTAITTATVGQPYSYDVNATDPEAGDVLSYSLDAAPAGMTIDGATGLITWTPGAAGDFDVTVRATDTGGLFATQAFTIAVQPAVAPVLLYFVTAGNTAVPGVGGTADDADIYSWDGTSFARVFDATAAGLAATANVDGLKVMGSQIYLSFSNDVGVPVPGVGTVQDEDVVVYDTSTSTWSLFLDGSDVGLTTGDEDVDAFDVLADGSVLISTFGPVAVPGVAGTWADEDVLRCAGSFGSTTTCTWSVYFDGSDVGLGDGGNNEDVDDVSMGNGRLYLSTLGPYSVPALTPILSNATANAGGDVFSCDSPVIGALSNCAGFSLYFRASDHGLSGNLDAFSVP
jgi:FtsP/CotA-like multicopper oxidase with cupredoxin domain